MIGFVSLFPKVTETVKEQTAIHMSNTKVNKYIPLKYNLNNNNNLIASNNEINVNISDSNDENDP